MVSQATTQRAPGRLREILARYRLAVERAEPELMAENYTSDALLDANVPHWRFQRHGREEILAEFGSWLASPPRVTRWHEQPCAEGALVELALFVGEGEDERYYRQANLLRIQEDRIVEHVLYCSGGWDREAVQRWQSEAPSARP